ncbi:sugar phosphate nucleotidyltransferase [Desulfoluna butyratoxydans]|uniref:sugar phosphate nucleotidyltransferase n=1 Tax=Desulfoluna butyratoxydans TaxID=231438 RepID=UPI0015D30261|nr:NTP transferase domain-containing protein [Desulfoluna butyratoxydans]
MSKTTGKTAVVVLAAGKGTRMKSDKAKVLHEVHGRPMVDYVMASAAEIAGSDVVVVVGHQADAVKAAVARRHAALFARQDEQLGTGHAVMCARHAVGEATRQVVILCGDVPLVRPETLKELVRAHEAAGRAVSVLAVSLDDPTGYGRMVTGDNGALLRIVEEKDAGADEKAIKEINSGIYCVDADFLFSALDKVKSDNAQGEYYLTDIVEIAVQDGAGAGVVTGGSAREVTGVNTVNDLETVRQMLEERPT